MRSWSVCCRNGRWHRWCIHWWRCIKPEDGDVGHIQNLWSARQLGNFSGDLDEWPKSLRGELKQKITTDRNGCTGKSCPFYSHCAFFTERRKRDEKDVIVANHALVMADLMLGGGVLLPAPEDCIYIFDEGHHLPDVAISQGASAMRLIGPQNWLRDVTRLPGKAVRAAAAHPDATQAIQDAGAGLDSEVQRLNDSLRDVHRYLSEAHPSVEAIKPEASRPDYQKKPKWKQPDPIWRFAMGRVPDELRVPFGQAHDVCGGVYDQALKLNEKIRKVVAKAPDNRPLGTVQSSAQWICGRLEAMHHALSQLSASGPRACECRARCPLDRLCRRWQRFFVLRQPHVGRPSTACPSLGAMRRRDCHVCDADLAGTF